MRVLFTSTHGRGHFQPMLPLAHALKAAGHDVRWAGASRVCERVRQEGFEATRAGLDDVANPDPPPEVAALPLRERPNHMFGRIFGPPRTEAMLSDLEEIIVRDRPDLLVCEQAELAGPLAAALAGLPNVTHAFGRVVPAVRLERAGEAMADTWRRRGLDPRPYAGTYDHLYVDIYPPSLQSREVAHVGERLLIRPAEPIWRAPDADPLVYITFGTVFNHDVELFATALEAARDLGVRVVVTLGPGNEPDALGEQPENVRVAEYIPQAELLPECAAVVSHAGSGTFLATLAAGVPQVMLPQAADQFLNAEAGDAEGVGTTLWPGEVSVESVRAALTQMLGDAEMLEAAERARDEIASMPSPVEVADELARLYG